MNSETPTSTNTAISSIPIIACANIGSNCVVTSGIIVTKVGFGVTFINIYMKNVFKLFGYSGVDKGGHGGAQPPNRLKDCAVKR